MNSIHEFHLRLHQYTASSGWFVQFFVVFFFSFPPTPWLCMFCISACVCVSAKLLAFPSNGFVFTPWRTTIRESFTSSPLVVWALREETAAISDGSCGYTRLFHPFFPLGVCCWGPYIEKEPGPLVCELRYHHDVRNLCTASMRKEKPSQKGKYLLLFVCVWVVVLLPLSCEPLQPDPARYNTTATPNPLP